MKVSLIDIERREDGIAILKLKRGEKRNALNIAMMNDIYNAYSTLHQSGCRVIILTAEGSVFCSGVDLHEIGDHNYLEASVASLARMLTTIFSGQIVTIGAVQGDAFGGGGGLAAACDIVVAVKEAHFGFPETRRGLVAAQVATILVRQIGLRHVRELLLTGEAIDAQRAFEIGLVNRVVTREELMPEALNYARKVLLGSIKAVEMTKLLITNLTQREFSEDLQQSIAIYRTVRESKEACSRIADFLTPKPKLL
ncbi:MAG: enoyl-CoA hydratase/isomerase family protein [Parachlamydiaceae bacterium]